MTPYLVGSTCFFLGFFSACCFIVNFFYSTRICLVRARTNARNSYVIGHCSNAYFRLLVTLTDLNKMLVSASANSFSSYAVLCVLRLQAGTRVTLSPSSCPLSINSVRNPIVAFLDSRNCNVLSTSWRVAERKTLKRHLVSVGYRCSGMLSLSQQTSSTG
jgi:hypothetical protein